MEVSRGIEEMHPQEATFERVRSSFYQPADRDARRVRRDDRVFRQGCLEALVKRPLRLELFDDFLDDEIAIRQSTQIVFRVPDRDEPSALGIHERRGLRLLRAVQPTARCRASIGARRGDIEQHHRNSG